MSTYYKGYKVRLDPTPEQISKLRNFAGAARFIWNYFLSYQKLQEEMGLDYKTYNEISRLFTELRNGIEFPWLKEVSAKLGHKTIKDLDKAIWAKHTRKPKFKSRRNPKQRFCPGEPSKDSYWIKNNSFNCLKIGYIKLKEYNYIPMFETMKEQRENYFNPRITFDGINWYLSIQVKCESQTLNKNTTEALGIDVGINNLITLSNGQIYQYDKKLLSRTKFITRRIRSLQSIIDEKKFLMKKQIGNTFEENKSKNLKYLELLLRKAYQREHNIRVDFIHKLTTEIIRMNPSKIVIEDINFTEMRNGKTKRFNRRLSQALLGEIHRQLEYKAMWNEIPLVKADRYYPSSKRCFACGHISTRITPFDKTFYCYRCFSWDHRDLNAAHNLVAYPVVSQSPFSLG